VTFLDGLIENVFVSLGWFGEAAQLANELNRRRPDLLVGRRWLEVVKCFDISTP
jgi:hypothetical protein